VHRKLIIFAGAGIALFAAATRAHCDTSPQAAPIVHALEARYQNAKTLKAIFLERYTDGRNGLEVESGTVYFSRPGRMRWEYESPENKLFISDGKTVWFFVPADHTVTRAPMKQSADWRTPLALLTGKVKLSRLCESIQLTGDTPGKPGNAVLRCVPRGEKRPASTASQESDADTAITTPDQPFDQVLLEVNPITGQLADVHVLEPGGIELDYRFDNWEENLPVADSLFHFHAPAGVAIVDESQALHSAP